MSPWSALLSAGLLRISGTTGHHIIEKEETDSGGHTCVRMRAGLEIATGRVSGAFCFE